MTVTGSPIPKSSILSGNGAITHLPGAFESLRTAKRALDHINQKLLYETELELDPTSLRAAKRQLENFLGTDGARLIQQMDQIVAIAQTLQTGGEFFATGGIGGLTRGAVVQGVRQFSIAPRVLSQLNSSRLGSLSGRLTTDDLQRLANNPAAKRFLDARSGHINVIQKVDGRMIRITVPRDSHKIISVGPIRENQVANRIASGDFIELK